MHHEKEYEMGQYSNKWYNIYDIAEINDVWLIVEKAILIPYSKASWILTWSCKQSDEKGIKWKGLTSILNKRILDKVKKGKGLEPQYISGC